MGAWERTEQEYAIAVAKVLMHIQTHIDGDISPRELADVAGYSPHHFHHVFRAVVGESVMDHIRRLRMERAALSLSSTKRSIMRIGFEAGYGAHEAFTRAFEMVFGVSPTAFRMARVSHLVPAACGVHYEASGRYSAFRPVRVVEVDQPDVGEPCAAHRLYGDDFEKNWGHFIEWVTEVAALVYQVPKEKGDMNTATIDDEILEIEKEVEAAKRKLVEARRKRPMEEVEDYQLLGADGNPVRLSALFGEKDDLLLIHNMGTGCPYCTMWADGFTGLLPHLCNRTAFALVSPDAPEVQKRFSQKRNWNFTMASTSGSSFNQDMGFDKDGEVWPGVSSFRRVNGRIYRIAKAFFSPGDDFCVAWSFFDLLEGGPKDWEPKYAYEVQR